MSFQKRTRVELSFALSLSFSSDSSEDVTCLGVTKSVKILLWRVKSELFFIFW